MVYDSVGKDTFMKSLDCLRPLGAEQFTVRKVNPAVNKVSEKSIEAIDRV